MEAGATGGPAPKWPDTLAGCHAMGVLGPKEP